MAVTYPSECLRSVGRQFKRLVVPASDQGYWASAHSLVLATAIKYLAVKDFLVTSVGGDAEGGFLNLRVNQSR